MLNHSAIIASRSISDNMTWSEKTMKATGLFEMVARRSHVDTGLLDVNSISVHSVGDAEQRNDIEDLLFKKASCSNQVGDNYHTMEMDTLVEQLAMRVEASMAFAQSVIAPTGRELIEKIVEARDKVYSSEFRDVVVPVAMAPIYSDPALLQMVAPHLTYSATGKMSETTERYLGEILTSENIQAAITTGINNFDSVVAEFLESEVGSSSYNTFRAIPVDSIKQGVEPVPAKVNPFKEGGLVVAFMVMHGLVNGQVADVDLTEAGDAIYDEVVDIRNRLAHMLDSEIQRMKRALDGNISLFFTEFASYGNVYYVNASEYQRWLKTVPGASLGAYLAFRKTNGSTDQDLWKEESVERLNGEWASMQRTRAIKADDEFAGIVNNIVKFELSSKIADSSEYDDGEKIKRQDELKKFFEEQPYYIAMPVNVFVRKATCIALDKGTDSGKILGMMDHVMSEDPDCTPDHAAWVAGCELVCDWIARHITIVKA